LSPSDGFWGARRAPLDHVIPRWDHTSVPELLLALALTAAPLAIGGVPPEVRLALSAVLVLAFCWRGLRLHAAREPVQLGLVGLAFGVALLWGVVQWLPLPAGLVELIAPASAEARILAAEALGVDPPGWMSLSLDGARSAAAIVGLLGICATFLLVANMRTDPTVRSRVVLYIEVAALAVLVVGVAHSMAGLDRLYGFYTATVDLTDRVLITPFVNENHAAALFLLGAVLAFGQWLAASRDSRWHLFVGVALTVGVLATMSRANTILVVVALALLGVGVLFQDRDSDARPRYLRLLIGVVCCGFVAVVMLGPGRWLEEMLTVAGGGAIDGLVTGCWQVGLDLISHYPLLGVGAGAFEAVAPAHMVDWNVGLVAYAHNGPLQVLAELGLLVGLPVMVLAAVGFGLGVTRAVRDLPRYAAGVAVLVVVVQNGVDFSLWIPGVGIPVAAALGLAVGWPGAALKGRGNRPVIRLPWTSVATIAAAGLLLVSGLQSYSQRPQAWQASVRAALADDKPGRVEVEELLLDHPVDFYAFHLGALASQRQGHVERAERLYARAHALAPWEPSLLAVRARQLAASDRVDEAWRLLERLIPYPRGGLDRAIEIALSRGADTRLAERLFAEDPAYALRAAISLGQRGEAEAAEQLLLWGVATFPDALDLWEELGARWSGRADRVDALDRLSVNLLVRAADREDDPAVARLAYLLQGYVLTHRGDPRAAWHMFVEAADLVPERAVRPLLAAGRAALSLGRYDRLGEVVGRLDGLVVEGAWPRGQWFWFRSHLAEDRGDLRVAIREMHSALRHLGHVPAYHDRIAELFARSGDATAATAAASRAQALRARSEERRVQPSPSVPPAPASVGEVLEETAGVDVEPEVEPQGGGLDDEEPGATPGAE